MLVDEPTNLQLLRQHGEDGMGTDFLAEEEEPVRRTGGPESHQASMGSRGETAASEL
jgi:hypothetical protein